MSFDRPSARRPARSLRPPPKPQRPSLVPRLDEDEEPTTRLPPEELAAAVLAEVRPPTPVTAGLSSVAVARALARTPDAGRPLPVGVTPPALPVSAHAPPVAAAPALPIAAPALPIAAPALPIAAPALPIAAPALPIAAPALPAPSAAAAPPPPAFVRSTTLLGLAPPIAAAETPRPVEAPPALPADAPSAPRRPSKRGAALFAAGVLVGIAATAAVLGGGAHRSPSPLQPAPLAAHQTPTPQPATPLAPPVAPAATLAPQAEPTPTAVARPVQPAPSRSALPVPSFDAPSCDSLLGNEAARKGGRQAAQGQTRVANRQLLLGNVGKAHVAYCRALAWDRKNVERHINLARLHLIQRDWQKAAQVARGALEIAPKHRSALAVLGDALAALQETEEARATWLQAEGTSEASPKHVAMMVRRDLALAQRVARKNDFTLAERLYRRVLLMAPGHREAMKGIATCLVKAGQPQAAALWARSADQLKRSG